MAMNEYEKLVEEAQNKRLELTRKQIYRIKKMYIDIAKDLEKSIKQSSANSLTERWLKDYQKQFKNDIKQLNKVLKNDIEDSMLKSAEYAAGIQMNFFSLIGDTYNLNIKETFSSMFSRIPKEALKELINGEFYKDGKGLSKRIWFNENRANGEFDYIIQKGLAEKKSVYDLAKDLAAYVNPNVKKDWDFKRIYPSVGNKKIEYNSFRLAVTSISHAYQLSMKRSCKANPFVEEIEWHTSNSHRGPCELCRSREGKKYTPDELPMDHPNGICYFTPVVDKSMEDIGSELKNWVDGEPNSILDKWYEDNGGKDNLEKYKKPTSWKEASAVNNDFKGKSDIKKYLLNNYNIKFSDSSAMPIDIGILSDSVNWLDKFHSYFKGFKEIDPVKLPAFKIKKGIDSVGYYQYYKNAPEAVELALNAAYFHDPVYTAKYVQECIDSKWTVSNAEKHKTFVHEYGHHIANSLRFLDNPTKTISSEEWCSNFICDIIIKYNTKYNTFMEFKDVKDLVSRYGGTKPVEAFAETFAEYFGGENPRKFAELFGEEVEKRLKDHSEKR